MTLDELERQERTLSAGSQKADLLVTSYNLLPEVIEMARAVELAESFASQDLWQEGDLWAIIFAFRKFKKKLGEQ